MKERLEQKSTLTDFKIGWIELSAVAMLAGTLIHNFDLTNVGMSMYQSYQNAYGIKPKNNYEDKN